MPQIDYNLRLTEGQEGLVTDLRPTINVSKVAEGIVGFGRALVAGTDPTSQVKIPSAVGQVFRGISRNTYALERDSALNAEYTDKSTVNVLRDGEIWVTVKDDVVIDTAVYYYITVGHWFSMCAAVGVALMTSLWLAFSIKYRKQ